MNTRSIVFLVFICLISFFIDCMEPELDNDDYKDPKILDSSFQEFYDELTAGGSKQKLLSNIKYEKFEEDCDCSLNFQRFELGLSKKKRARENNASAKTPKAKKSFKKRLSIKSEKPADTVQSLENINQNFLDKLRYEFDFIENPLCCLNEKKDKEKLLALAEKQVFRYLNSEKPEYKKRLNDFFMLMVKAECANIVRFFVQSKNLNRELKFDINYQDSEGNTALIIGCILLNRELVGLLLAEKSDVNIKNKFGQTALLNVVYQGNLELIDLLLVSENINLKIKNNSGQGAAEVAYELGRRGILLRFCHKVKYQSEKNKSIF